MNLAFLTVLFSCHSEKKVINKDLVQIDLDDQLNLVNIKVSKEAINFSLPENLKELKLEKFEDFNADTKKDMMVNFGACGTGGCLYGVFFNQNDNYYKLVFLDYLKGFEFEKDKNGVLSFNSYEEIRPYNPIKLQVTKYIFDSKNDEYKKDTVYIEK